MDHIGQTSEEKTTGSDARQVLRILMVEDDHGYRTLTRRLLIQNGGHFDFVGVGSLSQGLALMQEEVFDVLLLDLNLPDSSGMATLRRVIQTSYSVPVIVLTGTDDSRLGLEAVKLGAQDYLVKQLISNDSLIRCISYSVQRRKYEEAKVRLAAIQDFINTLAHDLQVPMIGSRQVLGLLSEGAFGELSRSQREAVDSLRSSCDDQLVVVRNLLELYRYEVESPGLVFEHFDIICLVRECVEAAIQHSGCVIEASYPEGELTVTGERQALRLLMHHLLQNAIEYSNCREPVKVRLEAKSMKVSLEVQNLGEPLPETVLSGCFERFWQGIPGKQYVSRTGIGLYLCNRIAGLHKGRLVAQSSAEGGTTMIFFMPLQLK